MMLDQEITLPRRLRPVAFVAAGTGILFGYGVGVIGAALPQVTRDFSLDVGGQAVAASIALIAAFLVAPVGASLSDAIGRRTSLLIVGITYSLGTVLSALAWDFAVFSAGRFLVGLSIGAASFIAPMYIAEVSPLQRRGGLVMLNQLMITIGIFVAALAGYLLVGHWRILLGIGTVPGIVLTLALITLPESPRWLVASGHGLAKQPGDGITTRPPLARERARLREILLPDNRRIVGIGLVIAVAVHFTGLNMAVYYAPTILAQGGLGESAATLGGTWVAGANVVITVITVRMIDKIGRRVAFIGGVVVMGLSATALGFVYQAGGGESPYTVVLLALFLAAAAAGPGGVFWTYVAELYSQRIRSIAMSVTAAAHWAADATVGATFLPLIRATSLSFTFWLYAVFCAIAAAFCLAFMPETRGRPLPE
jgi:MFS family permease